MEQQRPERRPAHRSEGDPEIQILIEAGIELARQGRRDVDTATARMIAHALALTPDSALKKFADTNDITVAEVRPEYLALLHADSTPDDARQLAHWLGAYLIHNENPAPQRADRFADIPELDGILWRTSRSIEGYDVDYYIPGDLSIEDENAAVDRMKPLIRTHGDPFLHFLEMNDVNAADEALEESYLDFYVGTFMNRDETIAAVIEIDAIEEGIRKLASQYAGAEFVEINRDELWERICEVWEVIESGDGYHVFNR